MSEYAYRDGAPTYPHGYLLPVIERLVRDVPDGATVVDLGCGNGALLRHFAARGWSRYGVEEPRARADRQLDAHFTALWDHGHIKFWSRRTLGALLAEAGLEVTGFQGAGRAPLLWKSMVVAARPLSRGARAAGASGGS